MKISYAHSEPPEEYHCHGCGIYGCKLWRPYQTAKPDLLCARCASKIQQLNVAETINSNGQWLEDGIFVDQIGWYVPAVPDEEGAGFWGYCAVPEQACRWWRALPSLRD